jgi:hypothetical protein
MIPIYWTERASIPNLHDLLEKVRQHGGSIVEYQRVFGIIVFTRTFPVFEWVPPHASRKTAGLKHVLFCAALGWWSVTGLFWTPAALIKNLTGGVDLTKVFTQPPPLPGQPFDNTTIAELNQARKRQQYAYVGFLLFVLLLVFVFCVIPYLRQ